MLKYCRTLAILAGVIMTFGIMTASATARRLVFSSQQIQFDWTQIVWQGSGLAVTCPITLEGSLHERTIDKTPEALVGYITRVIVGGPVCRGGEVRALTETEPWHIRYESFEGRLPDITGINFASIGVNILRRIIIGGFPVSCLYTTSSTSRMTLRLNRNTATRAISSVTAGGAIRSNTFGCPTAMMSGTGSVNNGAGSTVTVTLI